MKMEPYVKKWYDYLEEGKVMAVQCKKCGEYEFPPVPVCNTCGGYDMEWVEIDGEGTLLAVDECPIPMVGEETGPVITGIVQIKEGPTFLAFITGVEDEAKETFFEKLPLKVQVEILQRDGHKYPGFKVVNE